MQTELIYSFKGLTPLRWTRGRAAQPMLFRRNQRAVTVAARPQTPTAPSYSSGEIVESTLWCFFATVILSGIVLAFCAA